MSAVDTNDLRRTVSFWRQKAHDIQDRYGKQAPQMVSHCIAGIEACAQDIETHIREVELRPRTTATRQPANPANPS